MRGVIQSFDDAAGTGSILGDDGQTYSFDRDALAAPFDIAAGLRADFSPRDGAATQILLMPAATPTPLAPTAATSPWGTAETAAQPTPTTAASPWGTAPTTAPAASPWAVKSAPSTATTGAAAGAPHWASLFTSFNGRIRRSHFWIGVALLAILFVAANFLPFIGFFIVLALIWPNLAIGVKRLHDMGMTGWINAVPLAVNVVGGFVGLAMLGMALMAEGFDPEAMDSSDPQAIMEFLTPATLGPAMSVFGIVLLINLAFLAWIGAVDSQKGENRYGPNPKGE